MIRNLFSSKLRVLNIGLPSFARDMAEAGVEVVNLDWQPPAGGDEAVLKLLESLAFAGNKISEANAQALERLLQADPILVDIGLAGEVMSGLPPRTLLHAGPPVSWEKMCGPVKGAIVGAIIYEGWADSPVAAEDLAASGKIGFSPCHQYGAVGPMAGVLSPSMPVYVVENRTFSNRAYASINEGLGKVLRFGAFSAEVLERLKWLRDELYPPLRDAIRLMGGIGLRNITSQALHMGDECHNRNKAATALLFRELVPALVKTGYPIAQISRVLEFIRGNEHFYLNISMAACKATLDPAHGIPWSTMVTAMARNGTEFGVRVSGMGDQWFNAPALPVKGLYFPGFSEADANPDLGDSTITETCGIGGFAMASAPAIVTFVGGSPTDALEFTRSMYEITLGENHNFTIPNLNFRGSPTGIDILKVLEADVLPVINTGIAHREPGIGQIGAGVVNPPRECFV
ncbi:MAG: DUF1116 domain-containing protein, partial [Methanobacteriaceae archaeon]|nr:DUF1116 domain-containing protein [Methanobacteriaceae archaeon]